HGSGTVYFDDIRLYTPVCRPARHSEEMARLDFAPLGAPDCLVNYEEINVMADNWLEQEYSGLADAQLMNFANDDSQWVTGTLNNAIDLDGDDDYVVAEYAHIPTSAFTLSMWINPDSDMNSTSSRDDLVYWQSRARPHLTFNKAGTGEIGFWPNVGGDFDGPLSTTVSWNAGTWYHIAATFDGTNCMIYVNGTLEGMVAVPTPGPHEAASGPRIGTNNANNANFDGQIDDFRIYDYALSAGDVAMLAGKGEPITGPLFWYKFDETTGDIAKESVETQVNAPLPQPLVDTFDDGTINFKDYAELLNNWLVEVKYPQ
ncbi:MAG: LamG domain-containing protein, partial [Sedimentisphaerales bacterium]|nr:LamG domain-containing protein [Sedimentisphaerales bacterium]